MLKIAQTQSLDSKEIVRENLGQKFLLEKKLELLTFSPFFSGPCFLPIFFWKKCIFWDWPKSRGMVSKNEIFEKKFFSAKTLKNTKTKHFAAFWVKKNFSKFFFFGQIFSKFFLIFFDFFFQIFQKFQIFKFEKIEKNFQIFKNQKFRF